MKVMLRKKSGVIGVIYCDVYSVKKIFLSNITFPQD